MTVKEKLNKLEELLEIDLDTLSENMELEEIEEYDSMSKLGLLLMFEDDFGKIFTAKDIAEFKLVSDILKEMD